MPKMVNIEGNVLLELNLLRNEYLDIDVLREDFENWIPFNFKLNVVEEEFNYLPDDGATFTLYELRNMLTEFDNIISHKKNGLKVEDFSFNSSEGYFDIKVYDPLEENLLSLDVWINMGIITYGKSFGYNKGIRFDIQLNEFISFAEQLTQQFMQIYDSIIKHIRNNE